MTEPPLTGFPEFDKLEVVKKGTIIGSGAANNLTSLSVAHNLGYTPIMIAAVEINDTHLILPTWLELSFSTPVIQFQTFVFPITDQNNAYIQIVNAKAMVTEEYTFTYYLLRARTV